MIALETWPVTLPAMSRFAFAALAALAVAGPVAAQTQPASSRSSGVAGMPIVIGESYTLQSKVLGDTRRLNVWLPPSYKEGNKTYPVLILLDGGTAEDFLHIAGLAQVTSAYGRGREFIVVGIEGVQRRHDLSPPTDDPDDLRFVKNPGGAAQYRRFLAEEVKPWVAGRYRANGETGIIGESMAGLFILDTLAATPAAFTDYIAVSPIVWWNKQAVSKRLSQKTPATSPKRRLFIAFEGSMAAGPNGLTPAQEAEDRLSRALGSLPNVTITRLADEHHDTIYHPAALLAFRALYQAAPEKK